MSSERVPGSRANVRSGAVTRPSAEPRPARLPAGAAGTSTIAVERLAPTRPGAAHVLFCGGFHSSMRGDKARAVATHCAARGVGCTRFDYRGHGESDGDARALTLADWLDDALAVLDDVPDDAPLVVVGSSMGAWLAVHLAARRAARVRGLLLIAAAPDFLQHALLERLGTEGRARLERGGTARLATDEDPDGWPVTRALIDSGRRLALLDDERRTAEAVRCPVRMLHGTADDTAPWTGAAALLERLGGADATLTLVRGGDHRLSSPAELARLDATLGELLERVGG